MTDFDECVILIAGPRQGSGPSPPGRHDRGAEEIQREAKAESGGESGSGLAEMAGSLCRGERG